MRNFFHDKYLFVIVFYFIQEVLLKEDNPSSIKSNEIIPDIDLMNFDIRERFYECYNPGYDGDTIVIK